MDVSLTLTAAHYDILRRHLFPGDGNEAAAILLCGRRAGATRHRLLVRAIHPIPYEACFERSPVSIGWPTELMDSWLEEADQLNLSVVKVHSHPGDYSRFSSQDDSSDRDLFPCIDGWISADVPHASTIMMADGRMFGRTVSPDGSFEALSSVAVIGDDIRVWRPRDFGHRPPAALPAFADRHAKAFGDDTARDLRDLSVAVIGCSGTGSPTILQLARLGVGRLVIVDPDRVHDLNLNRIYGATAKHAAAQALKVDVLADIVEQIGLGTDILRVSKNLYNADAVRAVAECDVVFGCVDSAEGRFLLNLISNFYIQPYIDIGVTIETEADGEISQVCGYVHFLQPGGSSLLSRGAITLEEVSAEGMKRQNSEFYEEQRKAGYIKGVVENRPAVISVNTQFSGLAVTELLARLYAFREQPNRRYAKIGLSLSDMAFYPEAEPDDVCRYMSRQVGRGDIIPLVNLSELDDSPEL